VSSHLFENAELLDPERSRPVRASLLVEAGRIVAQLPPGEAVSKGVRRVDATGHWLAPGFLDLHFHGEFVFAPTDGLTRVLERTSRTLLAFGTTGYLVTSVAWPSAPLGEFVSGIARAIDSASSRTAVPLGLHLEGPWINPEVAGAQPPGGIRRASLGEFEDLLARASGALRMVTLAPEIEGSRALLSGLARAGVVAALGHSLADGPTIDAATGEGLRHVTHLFNAMGPMHHRDPGVAGHVMADDRLSCDIICDGAHVHPDMVVTAARAKRGRLALITDRVELPAEAARPGGDSEAGSRSGPASFDAAGLVDDGVAFRLASGRLAGSSLTLDRGLRNVCAMGAMTQLEAVAACSLLPARVLGIEAERGTLRAGARADFALLDLDMRVIETWIAGERVFSSRRSSSTS
jgi:N-acetylglucosamine-6-phosphate deacetylase